VERGFRRDRKQAVFAYPAIEEGACGLVEGRHRYAAEKRFAVYPDATKLTRELYPRAQEAGLVQLSRFGGGVGFPLAHLIAHIEQFHLP
jgi:hypothetical protein